MATRLKNVVRFVNVAVGATVALPHHLAWSPPGGGDLPQIPDILIPSRGGFTVTGDATNVTVTNNTGVIASIDVIAELWHTFERAFGDQATLELTPRPFVVNLDSGSAGLGAVLGFGSRDLSSEADVTDSLWPWYDNFAPDAEVGSIKMAVPRDGTLRNLYVRVNIAGDPGVVTYVVTKNGAPTALTVLSLDTGIVGLGSDLVHSVPVVAGDLIGMTATIGEEGGGGTVGIVATMLFDD